MDNIKDDVKVVAIYRANGDLITLDELKNVVFSHFVIDRILRAVNERLGLVAKSC